MANSAFDHSPTITVPGSSTNTALVRWSSTGADTFLDSTLVLSTSATPTLGIAADPDLLTFGNGTIAITGAITGVTTITATTFSGSGASLTNLPAANLTGTLPAISGANLTNLPSSGGGSSALQVNDSVAFAAGTGSDSKIYYDGTDSHWDLRDTGTGDLVIALGASHPSPDPGTVHIWEGTAGAVTASGDTQLVIESGGSSGIQVLTGGDGQGKLLFGDTTNDVGGLIYDHGDNTLDLRAGGAPQITIGTNVTVLTGNLVIGTAGQGIDFSAATPDESGAGSVSSEILDDYEEGTWTPRVSNNADQSGWTGDVQTGYYTKIGNIVFFRFNIRTTAMDFSGSLATGDTAFIHGLPFTSHGIGEGFMNISYGINFDSWTAGYDVGGYVDLNSTKMTLAVWGLSTGSTTMNLGQVSANGSLTGGGFYHV